MKKTVKILICVSVVSLMFSSCEKASTRINDLTIVQALGIDNTDNSTDVTLQYLNLFENSGSTEQLSGNVTAVKNGTGENISSAVFNASESVSNDVFFGQNKLVVFGYRQAQKSIDSDINYLLENKDSRPDVLAAIGYPNAKEIVKCKENSAQIPAENIYSMIKLGETNGNAAAVTVCDLLNLYNDETSDVYLPVLKAENDSVKCIGTAVFSLDKYAVFLNEEETTGFLAVNNRLDNSIITFRVEQLGFVSAKITSMKAKKSIEVNTGKPIFKIKIKTTIQINESEKTIKKPLTESDLKAVQKECENRIKSLCEKAVKKCYENKCDPFMSARYLYAKDIDLYNSMKDSWRSNLKNIGIEISVYSSQQRITNNTAQSNLKQAVSAE